MDMGAGGPVKHTGNHVIGVAQFRRTHRAYSRVFRVGRVAVTAAVNVREVIGDTTTALRLRLSRFGGKDLRSYGFSALEKGAAEGTWLENLKAVACFFGHLVGKLGEVTTPEPDRESDEERDKYSEGDKYGGLRHSIYFSSLYMDICRIYIGLVATLYVVATPIGNLRDITLRAVDTLKAVEMICCEDTRHSRKLLSSLGIAKPLMSIRAANEADGSARALEKLESGMDLAYVTDAGTPAVSDPGSVFVARVREADHEVVPIPGPSALTALMSASGLPVKPLLFEGFLSPKAGKRQRRLAELSGRGESFLIYESPHRLLKLLGELADILPKSTVVLGRELTKHYEEIATGTPIELQTRLEKRGAVKGECALLVWPGKMV